MKLNSFRSSDKIGIGSCMIFVPYHMIIHAQAIINGSKQHDIILRFCMTEVGDC
mgnify:FL=1